MANKGMLRGSGLREERRSVDTGTGEKRVGGNAQRAAHLGRGTFMNYYKDLGISATREGAKLIREDERKFQGQIGQQQRVINENEAANAKNKALLGQSAANVSSIRGNRDKAQGALNNFKGTPVPSFESYKAQEYRRGYGQGDYKMVRLYQRGGKSLYGEWYLPTSVANKIAANHTDSYWAGENGPRDVKVIIKHTSHLAPTAQLLQNGSNAMSNAVASAYDVLKDNAYATDTANRNILTQNVSDWNAGLTTAETEYGKINTGVNNLQTLINTQNTTLKGNKSERAAEWAAIHKKRDEKIASMDDFFASLDLEVK